jgi:hypothetical protein
VGKRNRQRAREDKLSAPTTEYTDAEGNALELRGAMSPASRQEYAAVLAGEGRPAATQEDAWHRAVEFLFERLVLRWTVADVDTTRQKELLQRLRFASKDERAWIRDVLRRHLAEWFPDMEAP